MSKHLFHSLIAAIFLAAFLTDLPRAGARLNREHVVKAAMIRNFAQFTRWPQGAFNGHPERDLTVCLMGDDSLLESFSPIRGKKVSGRAIDLRRVENISGLEGCNLLFVDKTSRTRMDRLMDSLQGKPVLTIGETDRFTRAGGIITFYLKNGKIRFKINRDAALRKGLHFSANLLELATIVETPTGSENMNETSKHQ